jgi:hypothetical protein
MTISPVAAATENAGRAHKPGISTPLGLIARLSMAAAALSLTIAAALSLIVWGAGASTTSDGGSATALGLAAAGIVFGSIFFRIRN